jgi:hypothetical protein
MPYSETLLATAADLIRTNQFSIAIVVVHMACEIATEKSISKAFADKKLTYLEGPIDDLLSGYNLANPRIQNLYNTLMSRTIEKEPFWQAFKESANRRNKIVHGGLIATEIQAKDSHAAGTAVVAFLQ